MVKFTKGKYEFREKASINAMFKDRSMHIAWDVAWYMGIRGSSMYVVTDSYIHIVMDSAGCALSGCVRIKKNICESNTSS